MARVAVAQAPARRSNVSTTRAGTPYLADKELDRADFGTFENR